MMAIGIGGMELLILILLTTGGQANDFAMLLHPPSYFKARGEEVTVENLIRIASQTGDTPKAQIAQLLALRQLNDDVDQIKKHAKFVDLRRDIEAIATGAKGRDPGGFAKEYALRVVAKLDGAPMPRNATEDPRELLRWFPEDATIVSAIDLRNVQPIPGADALLGRLTKIVPDREKLFELADQVGNIRFDAVAWGYREAVNPNDSGQWFLRIKGRFNHRWIVEQAKKMLGDLIEVTDVPGDGPRVTRVRLKQEGELPKTFAIVGDTDLIAGYEYGQAPRDLALLEKMLTIRATQGANATTGSLKDDLKLLQKDAMLMVAGRYPKGASWLFPVSALTLRGQVLHTRQGFDFTLDKTFESPEKAKEYVQFIVKSREQAIAFVKGLGQNGLPFPLPIGEIEKMLESIQAQAQGSSATMRMLVSNELLQAVPAAILRVAEKEGLNDQ